MHKIPFFNSESNYKTDFIEEILEVITPLDGWICGGFPAYLYLDCVLGQSSSVYTYNDVDIFCKNQQAFNLIMKEFHPYVRIEKDWCVELQCPTSKLQVIRPQKERTLQEIFETFDLSCSQIALTAKNELTFLEDTLPNINVSIKNISNPLYTNYRVIKYAQRGWRISPQELIKIFESYKNSSDEYKKELEIELLNYETAPIKARFERMMNGKTTNKYDYRGIC